MNHATVKPVILMMLIVLLTSIACSIGARPTATQAPTNTPVPTITLPPPPTDTLPPPPPTATLVPVKPTSAPVTDTPQVFEQYFPPNCYASTTSGFMSCIDENNSVTLEIPDYWTDVESGNWEFDGSNIGRAINAAPNLADFNASYTAEGVFFGASNTFALIGGYVEFLDYFTEIYSSNCDLDGRYDYFDGIYRGKYDFYQNCGGTGGYDAYVLSAVDNEDQFSMIILMYIQVTPGETFTVEQIWNTFMVIDL